MKNVFAKVVRGSAALGVAIGVCAGALACSDEADGSDTSGALTNGAALQVQFPKSYSAFIDAQHQFLVPAMVNGVAGAQWKASDPTAVTFQPVGPGAAGSGTDWCVQGASCVLMKVNKAGSFTIQASVGGLGGSSVLTVTPFTANEFDDGKERYNNGITWQRGPDGRRDKSQKNLACTNCHGKATQGGDGSNDVEHTPVQTGGYSDQDLVTIFTQGQKPPGVAQRIMKFERWTQLHRWTMTPEEQKGIVAYLRSLAPKSQGVVDFKGFGGHHGDGGAGGYGGPPPPGAPPQ